MTSKRKMLASVSKLMGFDPGKGLATVAAIPGYLSDLRALKKQGEDSPANFPFGRLYPCLEDKAAAGGTASGHYFHQDLLVARRIHRNEPVRHLDVGSRVDGLVAHVASFRPIMVMDIRRVATLIPNVEFVQADLMQTPDPCWAGHFDSLSCLHALEHFGLGRYGDPINFEGHLVGLRNLTALLATGGKLYLSVPIGPQRIEFNAHRVFSVRYLLECLDAHYRIDEFSYVDDRGDLHEGAPLTADEIGRNFGCDYGCGIVEATKI